MAAPGQLKLSRGEVLMYLDAAGLHRERAAALAGVSCRAFYAAMRRYRVRAPKYSAKLNAMKVREARTFLGKLTHAQVAERLGVHVRTVDKLATYVTWYQVR